MNKGTLTSNPVSHFTILVAFVANGKLWLADLNVRVKFYAYTITGKSY